MSKLFAKHAVDDSSPASRGFVRDEDKDGELPPHYNDTEVGKMGLPSYRVAHAHLSY